MMMTTVVVVRGGGEIGRGWHENAHVLIFSMFSLLSRSLPSVSLSPTHLLFR